MEGSPHAKGNNHAIVFGASGLLGWATVNQLLSEYPHTGTFSTVTAVVNRPVAEPDLYWPKASSGRPELQIVSGVDLRRDGSPGEDDLASCLKAKVPGAETISHAFYFVFAPLRTDYLTECKMNRDMVQRVADALNEVAPSLQSLVYSGGASGYGIYLPGMTSKPNFKLPIVESMVDDIPDDYAQAIAYPWFRRILTAASKNRAWSWAEMCPDAVVGFSPNGSAFSLALHWAQFLSLFAYNHGIRPPFSTSMGHESNNSNDKKIEVPFPGTGAAANALFSPVSERTLGRASVHAALNMDKCGEKVINVGDRGKPSAFREIWPALAAWFGLVGVFSDDDGAASSSSSTADSNTDPDAQLLPGEYVVKYRHLFGKAGLSKAITCGVGAGAAQLDAIGSLAMDRQMSLQRLKDVGFEEERDPVAGWIDAFERFRAAGMIF